MRGGEEGREGGGEREGRSRAAASVPSTGHRRAKHRRRHGRPTCARRTGEGAKPKIREGEGERILHTEDGGEEGRRRAGGQALAGPGGVAALPVSGELGRKREGRDGEKEERGRFFYGGTVDS